MKISTSEFWYKHFCSKLNIEKINWLQKPELSEIEKSNILDSLKAWQLGETSDGSHLLKAATKYSDKINDSYYPEAIKLFIKEEQKHGNNLGKYLDLIGEKRVKKDWGDSLFRKIRYYNTNMELWTLAVITVESTAQIFYQSLKDATKCNLLKEICTDILFDEAFHIQFQLERMSIIYFSKNNFNRFIAFRLYTLFYFITISVVWFAHSNVFKAGNNGFFRYFKKMRYKYAKTFGKMKSWKRIE